MSLTVELAKREIFFYKCIDYNESKFDTYEYCTNLLQKKDQEITDYIYMLGGLLVVGYISNAIAYSFYNYTKVGYEAMTKIQMISQQHDHEVVIGLLETKLPVELVDIIAEYINIPNTCDWVSGFEDHWY